MIPGLADVDDDRAMRTREAWFGVYGLAVAGVVSVGLLVAVLVIGLPGTERSYAQAEAEGEEAPSVSDFDDQPRRHFIVRDAALIDDATATEAYESVIPAMEAAFRSAKNPVAMHYRKWRRFNRAPYRSAAHGRRYVNNYGNGAAGGYDRYEKIEALPVGAIIAKDSFAVTRDGTVRAGPLFIMEKMRAGFNYVSGDWRFTMVMPDGSVFGTTKGANSDRVEYCINCHLAAADHDYLHLVPAEYRRDER